MGERGGPVIAVIGGSGGVGASSFAAVLALVAAPAVLVDLDCASGGADVLLGVERQPGARWSGLRLEGGRLDPDDLIAALPHTCGCAVLAADTAELEPAAVVQVIGAAAAAGTVVLDVPRAAVPARDPALAACDLVVVVARADVTGLVAAHATADAVTAALAGPRSGGRIPAGAVVRRGDVEPAEAARLVGLPLLGVLPRAGGGRFELDAQRPPRSAARVAGGVLAGVGS